MSPVTHYDKNDPISQKIGGHSADITGTKKHCQ